MMDDRLTILSKHIKLELENLFEIRERLNKRKELIKEELDKLPDTNSQKRKELEHELHKVVCLLRFNENKIKTFDTVLSILL